MKRLILCLAVSLLLAGPAHAQSSEPGELAADPRELRAGEPVTVSGEGCAPGNEVRFELRNPDLQSSVTANAAGDGTFLETIVLPSSTSPGRTWIRATCLGADNAELSLEAVLLVTRPQFVVTWTNILFGVGTAMLTAGLGLALLRPANTHRTRNKPLSRRRRRSKRRRRSGTSARPARVDVSATPPDGPELNGRSSDDPSRIEVE